MRYEHVDTTVLDADALVALAVSPAPAVKAPVGAWSSADGAVRLEIRTDGTYAGKVLGRKRPARGTYALEDGRLTLSDVSGLHTAVHVGDDVLEMAGHRLGRAS
ncbi:Atu4866 domain-containing protein [Paractinoplanes lichenicola]|uniref:Atu4866 domain-containing protein n=1 Tax=Paractinoplanes lichenicola TaxID=2802976 RepID=A0ABS1VRR8_9ACTN|nr:Atu4866 domain-containing protein [Actinoplanes lichenicola]MBL7257407.1 Atu4866 domain-containing protein [Actinoplanes lichenicola]